MKNPWPLEVLLSRHVADTGPRLPELAAELLGLEFETPSLAMLAGMSDSDGWSEQSLTLNRALHELGAELPPLERARCIAHADPMGEWPDFGAPFLMCAPRKPPSFRNVALALWTGRHWSYADLHVNERYPVALLSRLLEEPSARIELTREVAILNEWDWPSGHPSGLRLGGQRCSHDGDTVQFYAELPGPNGEVVRQSMSVTTAHLSEFTAALMRLLDGPSWYLVLRGVVPRIVN